MSDTDEDIYERKEKKAILIGYIKDKKIQHKLPYYNYRI